MKRRILLSLLISSSAWLVAQPPPPAPAQGAQAPVSTVSGSIAQFNYGPDARVDGFLLAPNTLVTLPPDWAIQVEMIAKPGMAVRVTGSVSATASGMQVVDAQRVDVDGKTLSVLQPSEPAPYAGSGAIRSLNYGREGEVNGFVLQNGVMARTPPFGASDLSVLRPGANISFSGFARMTPSGRAVVEVQSITANGQTIALNAMPPAGPGPRPGGPREAAAPPPPPPPAR